MKYPYFFFLICIFTIYYLIFTISPTPILAAEPVQVTATVPYYWWLELTGWTSPYASVELTMERIVKRVTIADDQGKFTFRIALPRLLAPFCLIATDISNISSHPLCLAPPPPEFDILIKEVVMPPTLKIDRGKIAKGETVAAQGYTTPNSEVVPYLFEEKQRKKFLISSLQSPVLAAEVPKPQVKSDQNGFYQLNLPSEEIGKNRIFVGSIFLANPSPKSTTLVFDVLSWWRMIIERLIAYGLWLLGLLLKFLTTPEGIILVEMGIIATIVYLMFRGKTGRVDQLNS